jgi:serine protease AprX
MRSRSRRSPALATVVVLIAAVLAGAAPAGASGPSRQTPAAPGTGEHVSPERLIVRLAPGVPVSEVAREVATAGGDLVSSFSALDIALVSGGAEVAAALADAPGVLAVRPDSRVRLQALGFDPAAETGSMTNITRITGAQALWRRGITGRGVDVALIDTGVAPVPGLLDATKIVAGPDLSFESGRSATRYLDRYGHGSHMAGIIGGREGPAGEDYWNDGGNLYGMAPDARIVSIKVADAVGAADVSQIIAAVQWVAQFGRTEGLDIRVLNLSLGLSAQQDPALDPLAWAAEVVWTEGIVVVAAAGNDGGGPPGLLSPAVNPTILSVGAIDTRGTDTRTDDTPAGFTSAAGGPWAPGRGPDVAAPGVGIVAPAVPGSYLHDTYPEARVGDHSFRGSGTSQAAAVVSGAAALLLQQRPWLSPDQVKHLLTSTASPVGERTQDRTGAGQIDLQRAARTRPPRVPPVSTPVATGDGSLDLARGGTYVAMNGVELRGEYDVWGQPWSTAGWADPATFLTAPVLGPGFAADRETVAGQVWGGITWAGRSWRGSTWTGGTWQAATFAGRSWRGDGWSAAVAGPVPVVDPGQGDTAPVSLPAQWSVAAAAPSP